MIPYILKIILCSGLLLLVYILFLEKEKMHRFNRFYLLLSIVIAIIAPSITFHIPKSSPLETVNGFVLPYGNAEPEVILDQNVSLVSSTKEPYDLNEILILVYWIITAIFLVIFMKNLLKMYLKIRGENYISYKGSKLILTDKNLTPHSFFNYIFLNKIAFENERIEPEILYHELTHTRQYHTIDVLLMELVIIFFWFNPFIYLYRKAIKLNHEFLADEGVINQYQSIRAYQYLLISKTTEQRSLAISSQFNFSLTKKRLIMITKNTSSRVAFLKYLLVVVVITSAIFAFSSKSTAAQENNVLQAKEEPLQQSIPKSEDTTIRPLNNLYAGGTEEGVSEKDLVLYQYLTEHIKSASKAQKEFLKHRMETIFLQMNLQQQHQQMVVFLKPGKPLPRIVPTQKQFEAFKNPKIYGVWVNQKKIPNNELNNFNAKDFAQVFVSKLYGAAKKGRSYSYQVNLMTKDYYQVYYNRAIKDTSNTMGFHGRKVTKK